MEKYFGYTAFRPGQEQLIEAILSGRDAFGVMPTGGGKSICYQVPAMLLPGLTLVISPLISLMKDQVSSLREVNIPAAYINSTLSPEDYRGALRDIEDGVYKIVYVAPERLESESFLSRLRRYPIRQVTVDEAHCISQWGQDFRPSYLKIAELIRSLPERPVVSAFTATATDRVREDVVRLLQLHEPLLLVTGFDRPNLRYDVVRSRRKDDALISFLKEHAGHSGIVYCATRAKTESVCAALCAEGFSATRYHAGLSDEERHANQEDFIFDRRTVMVATNAFGMGIDKSNVRFVVHYNMPKSIEEYYQEAGRAGRDGEHADCLLLFSEGDIMTAKYLIENGASSESENRAERIAQELRRMNITAGYCKTTRCFRGYILDYFGEKHPERCGNCGNCLGAFEEVDITIPAQMILSCVRRVQNRLGYTVGASLLIKTLRGSSDKRVRELGLDKLSTCGLMRGEPAERVKRYIEHLEAAGYLKTDPRHGGILLTEAAGDVLFRGTVVKMQVKRDPRGTRASGAGQPLGSAAAPVTQDQGLFDALRGLRRELSEREGVPAYIVFSDAALRDMVRRRPRNMHELLMVSGVGKFKAEKYGNVFLKRISAYEVEAGAS